MEFHKILVPVTGTEADEETIKLACELAKKDKGKILVVHVIVAERTLALDSEVEPEIRKAEDVLAHMESVAEDEDYEIETGLVQGREAGPVIIEEAVERGVGLILMGVAYQRRFGQFSLGGMEPYVLKNAPCRVMLYHQPIA